MTPTIIKAETWYFGMVITEWYQIDTLRSRPGESRVSKRSALRTIQDFHLRLVYKDSNGEVYAAQDGCFARYLALKEMCAGLTKVQAQAYEAEKDAITQFLKFW